MTEDELLARKEIEALRIGYMAHYDAHDMDALLEVFADDAEIEFPPQFGAPWSGKDAIRAGFAHWMKAVGEPFDAVHVVTNPWIEFTGPDSAKGRWYLLDYLTRQHEGGMLKTRAGHDDPLLMIGLYEDRYRKLDGRWRIVRSRLSSLWPERTYPGPLAD